jgi:hypothetical protein
LIFFLNNNYPSLGGSASGERVSKVIQSLDMDEDGRLSKEEFMRVCLANEDIRDFLMPL